MALGVGSLAKGMKAWMKGWRVIWTEILVNFAQ